MDWRARKLSILKIEVVELSSNDVDTLKKLPSLTALSLFVRTAPGGRIIFDKEDFLRLKYFKFMCTTVCVCYFWRELCLVSEGSS